MAPLAPLVALLFVLNPVYCLHDNRPVTLESLQSAARILSSLPRGGGAFQGQFQDPHLQTDVETSKFEGYLADYTIARIRGGEGGEVVELEEEEEEEEEEEVEMQDSINPTSPIPKILNSVLVVLTKSILSVFKALIGMIDRMARRNAGVSNFMDDVGWGGKKGNGEEFWKWVKRKYKIKGDDDDDEEEEGGLRMEGDFNSCLERCREEGLLTLVYLPNSKPTDSTLPNERIAASGVFDFNAKGYCVYGEKRQSKFGRAASSAVVKAGGDGRQGVLLAVVAARYDRRTGRSGIKVLAQHHCNPPPGKGEMGIWGKAVRKRYKGVVKGMKKEVEERGYDRERMAGYEKSVGEDKERGVKEEKEKERLRKEEEDKLRKEIEIKERRVTFEAELPVEPGKGEEGCITVSVMHEGVRKKRMWDKNSAKVKDLMKWCDVTFEVDRDEWTVVKSNGGEVEEEGGMEGWGKMTGLRLVKKKEGGEGEGEGGEEE